MEILDQTRKKRVSLDVFRLLNDTFPIKLRNMFMRHADKKDIRGERSRRLLPKVRTEQQEKCLPFKVH